MKTFLPIFAALVFVAQPRADTDEVLDQVSDSLTFATANREVRAHLSGTIDLEEYTFDLPAPALIYTSHPQLFNPRLTLYLDTQLGSSLYGFVQVRADHGFDPSAGRWQTRLDEYALRYNPKGDAFQIQVGKFSAVVGNWIRRHGSWDDAFVSAPLPYESLTGVWDVEGAPAPDALLMWSHVWHNPYAPNEYDDKELRLPIIWGPSYTQGASISGKTGPFEWAGEIKSASLSSRPDEWGSDGANWHEPTFNAELSFRPNPTWNVGISYSNGPYLRDKTAVIDPEYRLSQYREVVLGQDFEYSWRHWQLWAEAFEAHFENPVIPNIRVFGYYIENRYQFSPQWFGAIRWNQEVFSDIDVPGRGPVRWGRNTWRIDVAPTYRLTRHVQLKVQYSLQKGYSATRDYGHTLATQITARF